MITGARGKKGVSVIVCCFNSALRIKETLQYIQQQEVPAAIPWELIIVDNASIDNTNSIATDIVKLFKLKNFTWTTVTESQPGLSIARKKGANTAQYEYLIFCDDDNWLNGDFLATAYRLMEAHPNAGAIGGIGTPVFESSPPAWFKKYQSNYAVGSQGLHGIIEDVTRTRMYVFGAGIVVRKKALEELSYHNYSFISSDRIGNQLLSGGDNELCYCLIIMGYKIYYTTELKFRHYLPAVRLTEKYLLRLHSGFGYSGALLQPYMHPLKMVPITKLTWKYQFAVSIYLLISMNFFKQFLVRPFHLLDWKVNLYNRIGGLKGIYKERRSFKKNIEAIKAITLIAGTNE